MCFWTSCCPLVLIINSLLSMCEFLCRWCSGWESTHCPRRAACCTCENKTIFQRPWVSPVWQTMFCWRQTGVCINKGTTQEAERKLDCCVFHRFEDWIHQPYHPSWSHWLQPICLSFRFALAQRQQFLFWIHVCFEQSCCLEVHHFVPSVQLFGPIRN